MDRLSGCEHRSTLASSVVTRGAFLRNWRLRAIPPDELKLRSLSKRWMAHNVLERVQPSCAVPAFAC
jgi:hypothetical protein